MPIILVPQPSDDPNDPLNWPLWKRDMSLVILSILSVIASTLSPLLAANTVTLSLLFNKDFAAMALATGYHLLGVGVAGFLFVASARVWGSGIYICWALSSSLPAALGVEAQHIITRAWCGPESSKGWAGTFRSVGEC